MSSALPPNLRPLEAALEGAMAAADLPVDYARLLNADACPAEFLPFLAWHFSVDDWSAAYPDAIQRGIVRGSIEQHRRRGTVAAVRAALDAAGWADAAIFERGSAPRYGTLTYGDGTSYDPGDHWAEYRVRIPRPMTDDQAAEVRALLERAAPLRCRLIELSYTLTDFVYGRGDAYGARNYGGTQYV